MGSPPAEFLSLSELDVPPPVPGNLPLEVMMLHYPDERIVLVLNTLADVVDYYSCEVWGRTPRKNPPIPQYVRSRDIGDAEYLNGSTRIVELFKQMMETQRPSIPYERDVGAGGRYRGGQIAQRTRCRAPLANIIGGEALRDNSNCTQGNIGA